MEDKLVTKIEETKRDILNSKQVKKILDNKLVKKGIDTLNKGIRQAKLKTLDKSSRTDEQQLRVLLIRSLESSNNILLNKEKFNIAYDYIINNKPLFFPIDEKYEDENIMEETFKSLKEFFNNEFINNLNNDEFNKYLNNGLKYANYYIFNKITHSNLNIPKKIIALNYCYNYIENFYKYNNLSIKQIEKELNNNIFKIIFNPKHIIYTDKEYEDVLNKIKKSDKPLNYSNILNDNLLSQSKKNISLKILDESDFKDNTLYSKVALSKVLRIVSNKDYETLLKIYIYYYSNKDLERLNLLNTLYNNELLITNLNRFNKFINKVIEEDNLNYLNAFINDILTIGKSLYYNDFEIETLYNTLKNIYITNNQKYKICVNLCTSEKIKTVNKLELINYINTHDINELSVYFSNLNKISSNYFKNAYELLKVNVISKITDDQKKEELKYSLVKKN